MKSCLFLGLASAVLLPGAVAAQTPDTAALIQKYLYKGAHADGLAAMEPLAETGDSAAQFGVGVFEFMLAAEHMAQAHYRHGFNPVRGFGQIPFFAMGGVPNAEGTAPGEPLTYGDLRDIYDTFVTELDDARAALETAGGGAPFAVAADPFSIRFDVDGDGTASEREAVAVLLAEGMRTGLEMEAGPEDLPRATFGFDNADAFWLAGYAQILASQGDFLLAHDFSETVAAVFHRLFPGAGLPMDSVKAPGRLFLDPDTDTLAADAIALIHSLDWPVTDSARLANVRERLLSVIALSRRNWDAILAETDDDKEFLPGPQQTPVIEGAAVTQEMVEAWRQGLTTAESILNGELLLPHWRFAKGGFDLKAYFESATRTDAVMVLTGYGALPFMAEGRVVTREDFAPLLGAFGETLWGYAFWFN